MDTLKIQALSKIEVFQDLSPDEVQQIDQSTTMTTCESGRVFYAPEETGEVLFLLKNGRVELYRLSPEGKKLVVAVLGPGSIFGEMSIVGHGMHNTFAESLDECLICVMSRVDVERLLTDKPKVALRFMQAMANRLQQAEEKLEDIAFKSVPARLAALLLKLAQDDDGSLRVDGYTHQDLADVVGTYRETATQVLNDFKANGWVDIGRKRVEILDRQALANQAES
ncbi:MAG: Crp/Fnr family transcriptional regulator [Anaerolineales bacterium]